MTGRAPYHNIAMPFCLLLVILTLAAAPAHAGILERVKSVSDYAKGILEEGMELIKEGMSGNIDSETYNRRADEFFHGKRDEGIKVFLKNAADRLKLKVSSPLKNLKGKLANTLLGKATASVKEKIQTAIVESVRANILEPDEQYVAVDPRIALDINEEESEWYQAETSILDETPLPQEGVVAHVDESRAVSPDSAWYASDETEEERHHVQPDCEIGWSGCPDDSSNREFQANAYTLDPWSAGADGSDAWGDDSSQDCKNQWGNVLTDSEYSTDCREEYQNTADWNDEADGANGSDDTQDIQGANYTEALKELLDNDKALSYDEYSASDRSYPEALVALEARVAAEQAEREARRAAERAERAAAERARASAAAQEQAYHSIPSSAGPTGVPNVQHSSPGVSRSSNCQEDPTPTCKRVLAMIEAKMAPIQARLNAGGLGIYGATELTAKMLKIFLDHAPTCFATETRPQCIAVNQRNLAEVRRSYESALKNARQLR